MSKYTLKFEGFNLGDLIRAYDFEPRASGTPCFVEGLIVEISRDGTDMHPYAHYVVNVTKDTMSDKGDRVSVMVPMESSMDWDGRVTLVEAPEELPIEYLIRNTA